MSIASIKLALRMLARRKVFTAISLVGISLTLVVLVVGTAVLDNIFAAHAPQSNLDRLLVVSHVRQQGHGNTMSTNPGRGLLDKTIRNLRGVEHVTIFDVAENRVVYQGARRLEVPVRHADAEYWRVFDFRFVEGAPFAAADESANRSVVVITSELARQLYGDGPAVGKPVDIGGQIYHVAGVVARPSVAQLLAYGDAWLPLAPPAADERDAVSGQLFGVVLARGSDDFAAIKRQFASRLKGIPTSDPKMLTELHSWLETPFEMFANSATHYSMAAAERAPALVRLVLAVLALLFMTLPALNLVTLNLSRILERASEIGVRKAFGAPRPALIGQFVLENVILTTLGGVIAFGGAYVALRALEAAELMPGVRFSLNGHVFLYGVLIAVFFGVFSGTYPAWRMSRLDPVEALRGGAH